MHLNFQILVYSGFRFYDGLLYYMMHKRQVIGVSDKLYAPYSRDGIVFGAYWILGISRLHL